MQDLSNYETVKKSTDAFYKKIGRIRCQALNNEYVHFTSEGFNHLLYDGSTERSKNDQMTKLKLVPRALKLLKLTTTIQEKDECIELMKIRMKKRREEKAILVKYWCFIAIIDDKKIKVIVRQTGTGQKHFYSVIPFWTVSHYGSTSFVSQAKGNLKKD